MSLRSSDMWQMTIFIMSSDDTNVVICSHVAVIHVIRCRCGAKATLSEKTIGNLPHTHPAGTIAGRVFFNVHRRHL